MGYINPLLRLHAGQELQRLPKADRARIEAVIWRAVSTCARHVAHALATDTNSQKDN